MKINRSNIVCIVLMSILIVCAVSLCVFYNLNALAPIDVAYASSGSLIPFTGNSYIDIAINPLTCDTSLSSDLDTWLSNQSYSGGFLTIVSLGNDIGLFGLSSGSGDYAVIVALDNIYPIYSTGVWTNNDLSITFSSGWSNLDSNSQFYWSTTSFSEGDVVLNIRSILSSANGYWDGIYFGIGWDNSSGDYADGYADGYDDGYRDGEEDGFNRGYLMNYNSGYNLGTIFDFQYHIMNTHYQLGDIDTTDNIGDGVHGSVVNNGLADIYYSYRYTFVDFGYGSSDVFYPFFYLDLGSVIPAGTILEFDTGDGLYINWDDSSASLTNINGQLVIYPSGSFSQSTLLTDWQNLRDNYAVSSTTSVAFSDLRTENYVFRYTMSENSRYIVFALLSNSDYLATQVDFSFTSFDGIYSNNSISYINIAPKELHRYFSIEFITSDYDTGYYDGYVTGKNVGYVQGYEQSYHDGHGNSFLGLFSAVIDAPVNVISQALDFELLGYNVKNFLFALLSIALVLFVVKLFI